MKDNMLLKRINACGICGSLKLESIWELPKLSLTEMFGTYEPNFPAFDQSLIICQYCGHVQLGNQLDPNFLYQPDQYAFRTLPTLKIQKELEFLTKFILKSIKSFDNQRVLEIGSSNLQFAKQLRHKVKSYAVCDPLLVELDGQSIDEITIYGKFAEELSVKDLNFSLIFGRHVLEHMENPFEFLSKISAQANDDTIFVFEVPSLTHIRGNYRFDAIFHQHCHYFDLSSIRILVQLLGCSLVDYTYNQAGSNGGSLIFAFKKSKEMFNNQRFDYGKSLRQKVSDLKKEIDLFNHQMNLTSQYLNSCKGVTVGYGAAHMLATLNYHLSNSIEGLDFILDDNSSMDGFQYKNIKVTVRSTENFDWNSVDAVFITSMENRRFMTAKIIQNYDVRVICSNIL
jgi:hypothetical protein